MVKMHFEMRSVALEEEDGEGNVIEESKKWQTRWANTARNFNLMHA